MFNSIWKSPWLKFTLFVISLIVIFLVPLFFKQIVLQKNYLAATIDKNRRLSTVDSPKLVLIGGSNLAFGIDSQYLEENLAGYNVVNMGLHAGVGCVYPLREITHAMKPGDVVVIIPEYGCFSRQPLLYGNTTLAAVVFASPGNIFHLSDYEQWQILMSEYQKVVLDVFENIKFVRRSFFLQADYYNRDAFNEYGDVVSHINEASKNPTPREFVTNCDEYGCDEMIEIYNRFYRKMKNKGVEVYLTFPPYNAMRSDDLPARSDRLTQYLDEHLDMPLFGTPIEYFYDARLFYDTMYHLTWEARRIHTESLLKYLKDELY